MNEIEEFGIEVNELLDLAEEGLLHIDGGAEFSAHYDEIFRVFHNIKGGAGMLGLEELQEHVHKVETILHNLKKENDLQRKYSSFFIDAVDATRTLLQGDSVEFDYSLEKTESDIAEAKNETVETVPAEVSTTEPSHEKPAAEKVEDDQKTEEEVASAVSHDNQDTEQTPDQNRNRWIVIGRIDEKVLELLKGNSLVTEFALASELPSPLYQKVDGIYLSSEQLDSMPAVLSAAGNVPVTVLQSEASPVEDIMELAGVYGYLHNPSELEIEVNKRAMGKHSRLQNTNQQLMEFALAQFGQLAPADQSKTRKYLDHLIRFGAVFERVNL